MVTSKAETVTEYLASLPDDRRKTLKAVRKLVRAHLAHLGSGIVEQMAHGMISWVVPLSRYPETYNGEPLPVVCLASQKNYCSLYLFCAYTDPAERKRFEQRYARSGKRLDMGQSCVRFKQLEDLAQDVIAETLDRVSVDGFIAVYERARKQTRKKK
jgi:hypothetical protein